MWELNRIHQKLELMLRPIIGDKISSALKVCTLQRFWPATISSDRRTGYTSEFAKLCRQYCIEIAFTKHGTKSAVVERYTLSLKTIDFIFCLENDAYQSIDCFKKFTWFPAAKLSHPSDNFRSSWHCSCSIPWTLIGDVDRLPCWKYHRLLWYGIFPEVK